MSISNSERRRSILFANEDLRSRRCVEIGPLDAPIIRKDLADVFYVDHALRGDLVKKYQHDANVKVGEIQEVDAVWGARSLSQLVGNGSADYMVASHVAEHVPDLIGWLQEIEAVLRPGGELCLVVPDKRMSFDCRRRETVLVEAVDAFVRKARIPQTYQLLDCALRVVNADHVKLYNGEAVPDDFPFIHTAETAMAIARQALQTGDYIDVHCWVFTPKSFAALMGDLVLADLIHFACSGFVDTSAENAFEFFVKLKAGASAEEALDSWRTMHESASLHVRGSCADRLDAR